MDEGGQESKELKRTATENIWELNESQEQRSPLQIADLRIRRPSEADIQRLATTEFRCPICLDILRTAMAAKECFHRFCLECITTALRAGNKECPACRAKLVSRRSLRNDFLFDGLIQVLFPDRAIPATVPEIDEQSNDEPGSPRKRRKTRSSTSGTASRRKRSRQPRMDTRIYPCEACNIPIILSRLDNKNDRKFLKTEPSATIGHLRRYTRKSLEISSDDDDDVDNRIRLLMKRGQEMTELSDDEIEVSDLNDANEEIHVFYDVRR